MPSRTKPLTDDDLECLEDFLSQVNYGNAMNAEELDGFFCALICGPDLIPPSEYLPYVWGGELIHGRDFQTLEAVQEIISLLMRHWNTIAETLLDDEPYMPLLFEDENGETTGNDWAAGFEQGITVHPGSWNRLFEDDDAPAVIVSVMVLAHEHDPDPELRPSPVTPEKRETLLELLAATPLVVYRYFRGLQTTSPPRAHRHRTRR